MKTGQRTTPSTVESKKRYSFGGAKDQNQRNDVTVIYEAHKYGALLITNDGGSKTQPGGILGNRDKLKGMVRIFSDVEAVDFIRSRILERDEMNRRIAREFALPLPEGPARTDQDPLRNDQRSTLLRDLKRLTATLETDIGTDWR
ncbi:MAG: hypothetical protein IPG23_13270, partial [Burkholderiales bacterium]|nr:hypothetical protein [Burkholderiales bacterium]